MHTQTEQSDRFFFSMKIYATARGTQVADANMKYTVNNDSEQGRTYNRSCTV